MWYNTSSPVWYKKLEFWNFCTYDIHIYNKGVVWTSGIEILDWYSFGLEFAFENVSKILFRQISEFWESTVDKIKF